MATLFISVPIHGSCSICSKISIAFSYSSITIYTPAKLPLMVINNSILLASSANSIALTPHCIASAYLCCIHLLPMNPVITDIIPFILLFFAKISYASLNNSSAF